MSEICEAYFRESVFSEGLIVYRNFTVCFCMLPSLIQLIKVRPYYKVKGIQEGVYQSIIYSVFNNLI